MNIFPRYHPFNNLRTDQMLNLSWRGCRHICRGWVWLGITVSASVGVRAFRAANEVIAPAPFIPSLVDKCAIAPN